MGGIMIETKKSSNNRKPRENNVPIDTINIEKMNFKIFNRSPGNNPEKTKDIEKRLFEIFKKYEG